MRDLKIWVRVGDQDDYHAFDSPELAAEHVHEYLHFPDHLGAFDIDSGLCDHGVERYKGPGLCGIGLTGTPYMGDNAVSLYWGDDDAHLEAELSDMELEAFSNSLV